MEKTISRLSFILLGGASLLCALALGSCTKDPSVAEESATLTIGASVKDGPVTRAQAISGELFVGVFNEDGTLYTSAHQSGTFPQSLKVNLIKGMAYKLVFWAQEDGQQTIAYGDSWTGNDLKAINVSACKDAFTKAVDYTMGTDPSENNLVEVTLERPFARVALLVTSPSGAGLSPTFASFTAEDIPTVYNALSGEFSTPGSVTAYEGEPTMIETTSGETSCTEMLHFFIPAGDEASTFSGSYILSGDAFQTEKPVTGVTIRRNFRTNIITSL